MFDNNSTISLYAAINVATEIIVVEKINKPDDIDGLRIGLMYVVKIHAADENTAIITSANIACFLFIQTPIYYYIEVYKKIDMF